MKKTITLITVIIILIPSIIRAEWIPLNEKATSFITLRVNYGTGKIVNPKTTVEKANEAITAVSINHWNRKNHFL